jgi:hypothetical protein
LGSALLPIFAQINALTEKAQKIADGHPPATAEETISRKAARPDVESENSRVQSALPRHSGRPEGLRAVQRIHSQQDKREQNSR